MDTEENQLLVQYKDSFKAIKIYDNNFIISNLNVVSDLWLDADELLPEEVDREIDMILMKLQIFFDLSLKNSIIISKSSANEWLLEKILDVKNNKKTIKNNIILIPGEPGDDHLCMLLQSKFDAIGEGKLFFTSVSIKDRKSKNIKFTFVGDGKKYLPNMYEWMGQSTYHDEPWWARNDLSTIDFPKNENIETPFYDIKFESVFLNKIFEQLGRGCDVSENKNFETEVIKLRFKPKIIRNEE